MDRDKFIEKITNIGKFLRIKAGKEKFPAELRTEFPDIIAFLCDLSEDELCAILSLEIVTPNTLTYTLRRAITDKEIIPENCGLVNIAEIARKIQENADNFARKTETEMRFIVKIAQFFIEKSPKIILSYYPPYRFSLYGDVNTSENTYEIETSRVKIFKILRSLHDTNWNVVDLKLLKKSISEMCGIVITDFEVKNTSIEISTSL
ncbi:MAG TPA: hypothetical protein VI821_00520 [Candidatus Paceibacterota bacterium]